MARPGKYVVIYDITDDAERFRLAKVLEGFGLRVQKSAFECDLTRGSLSTLAAKLKALELKSGYLHIYRRDSKAKRLAIGNMPPNPLDEARYAFVL